MSHVITMLRRELRIGPRSPFVYWALIMPAVLTAVAQGVFGGLFDPAPSLAIVDHGASEITVAARALEGIDVTLLDTDDRLYQAVEANDFDAGLILRDGFDASLRAGERPPLDFHVAGESLASNRAILAVSVIDLVREVDGSAAPVSVDVVALAGDELNMAQRMIPLVVMMAVAIAGAFVPAASLVQEKVDRTISAMLVTPARMNQILGSKLILGVVLAILTGMISLWMNDAFGASPLLMALSLLLAALMMAEIGIMLGSWAPDQNTLFAAWKGGASLIVFPIVFFMFPTLPQWIAKLGPTYYFLQPIFDLALFDAGLADVALNLGVAAAICVALVPFVVRSGRSLERRMGE